jgi:hypothetical protein
MYAEGQEEALLEAAVWAEAATLAEDVHKVAGPQPGDSAGRHAARGRTHRVAVPHGDRGNCRPVGRAAALAAGSAGAAGSSLSSAPSSLNHPLGSRQPDGGRLVGSQPYQTPRPACAAQLPASADRGGGCRQPGAGALPIRPGRRPGRSTEPRPCALHLLLGERRGRCAERSSTGRHHTENGRGHLKGRGGAAAGWRRSGRARVAVGAVRSVALSLSLSLSLSPSLSCRGSRRRPQVRSGGLMRITLSPRTNR